MQPDQIVTWATYVLDLEHICRHEAISLPAGAEIEADIPERGKLRLTIKSVTNAG